MLKIEVLTNNEWYFGEHEAGTWGSSRVGSTAARSQIEAQALSHV